MGGQIKYTLEENICRIKPELRVKKEWEPLLKNKIFVRIELPCKARFVLANKMEVESIGQEGWLSS